MSKIVAFVVAFVLGFAGVALVQGSPAVAAPYGGCNEAAANPGTYGALVCAVNAEAEDESWVVKATRDGGEWGVQVRTDDGPRWTVLVNGKVVDSWKYRGLKWWEQGGNVVRNTFLDIDVPKGKRFVLTLERDGERVYRSGVTR